MSTIAIRRETLPIVEVFSSFRVSEPSMETRPIRTRSCCCPWIFGHHLITVEPVIFLHLFAISLCHTVMTQFLLVRTCEVTLGMSRDTCRELERKLNTTAAQELEDRVQPSTSTLVMTRMIIESFLPATLALFLGPWSDKYGRKLLMIWPLLGYTGLYYLSFAMSLFPRLHPYYILVTSLPVVFSGGYLSVLASTTAFLTDITQPERRSLRMGIFYATLYLGFFLGTFLGGKLFTLFGDYCYMGMFAISGSLCFVAAMYVIICVPESVITVNRRSPVRNLTQLFDWDMFVNTLHICFRSSANCHRGVIFMMSIVMATGLFTFDGENAVSFLYVRKKFQWDIVHFTIFCGATMLVIVIGTLVGVTLLSSYFKVDDLWLIIFALLCKIVSSIMTALAKTDWVLYIASAVRFFGELPTPLSHAFISKNIPKDIIGIVFSLASATEALMPVVAAPMYTAVYNATFQTVPGAFLFVSSSVYVVAIILTCICMCLHKPPQPESTD